jgi:hypothetical protein
MTSFDNNYIFSTIIPFLQNVHLMIYTIYKGIHITRTQFLVVKKDCYGNVIQSLSEELSRI